MAEQYRFDPIRGSRINEDCADVGKSQRPVPRIPRDFDADEQSVSVQARRVAHDFRNLLMVVETRVELAQMDSTGNAKALVSLRAARAALAEARELTNVLDGLGQSEAPVAHAPINLGDVVRRTVSTLRASLPESIQLIEDLRVEPAIWVDGESVQISRLVRNLIVNAREAMPSGGRLVVSLDESVTDGDGPTGARATEAVLEIADTGEGMTPAVQAQIFEPFFTTKSGRGGTGLGLPIVREIAEAHHARISLVSSPERGTRIGVRFPMRSANGQRGGQSPIVLVVGAETDVHGTFSDAAQALEGFNMAFARSGAEALRVIEREQAAVGCLVLVMGTLSDADVALLRALRGWRGRRGVVLVDSGGAVAGPPIPAVGESLIKLPLHAGDLAQRVRASAQQSRVA
jgi:hypothetical protein